METLGFYAAAVVAATSAGVDNYTLNLLSFSYLATRLFYNYIYVWGQDNRKLAPVRSLIWTTGVAFASTMYIMAVVQLL